MKSSVAPKMGPQSDRACNSCCRVEFPCFMSGPPATVWDSVLPKNVHDLLDTLQAELIKCLQAPLVKGPSFTAIEQ